MKKLLLVALLSLSGCAELKKGYVKVDFVDGEMTQFMICHVHVDREGDLVAECRDLDKVAEELRQEELKKKKLENQL